MERQVGLVLVALCTVLGCACSCEFQERPSRAPEPLLLASPLEIVPDADADSCRALCCAHAACDAAVLALPQDAPAQCFLLSCDGACTLREDNNSQFRVFTRSDARAPDTSLRLVPLMLATRTRTEDQRNSTNGTGVCTLPHVVGLCKAAFPRFYFDAASGSCRRFIFGGCGGNGNNFVTQEECEATCPRVKGADEEKKKPQTKSARMAPQTELSEDDPEETRQDKEMTQDEHSELCLAPLVVGPCRAAFSRWFFNSSSGRCERFVYGGCRGNKNNYEKEELCTSTCAGVKVLSSKKLVPQITAEYNAQCGVAPDPGPCRAAFPMFYFDLETQSCKSFLYGGCRGNDNRYGSEDECTEKCVNTAAYAEGQGKSRNRWTAAFFLFLGLAAISFLLLTALIFITLRRNRTPPRRALSIRSDKEELLPDSESVDSLPLPESPGKA